MRILSVHSHVASGHVGNDAVMLPLQRLGAEVLAVHTLQFSNHPGHGAFGGRVFAAAEVADVLRGLAAHGALGACDPVLGDDGRLYVRPETAAALRDRLVPAADIATPNAFELGFLTGMPTDSPAAILAAARALAPRTVLVTSAGTAATPADATEMILSEGEDAWRLRTPRLPRRFNGAGDMLAGLFLFHRLAGGDAVLALERAAAAVHAVLRRTVADGRQELALVAAGEEIVSPPTLFRAEPW